MATPSADANTEMSAEAIRAARASLQMPDVRSLQLFQSHLAHGAFKTRHLDALSDSPSTRAALLGMLECTTGLNDQLASGALGGQSQQKKVEMRNVLCLCRNVCPEETLPWVQCMRNAAQSLREAKRPPENCEPYRRRLERCAANQTELLLRTALLPPDRDDDIL